MSDKAWPFDQPPNCATLTLRSIIFGGAPILHVSHDEDDHAWQFLAGGTPAIEDAAVVLLSEISERDPTVLAVADLPPGWIAWRNDVNSPWHRSPRPPD